MLFFSSFLLTDQFLLPSLEGISISYSSYKCDNCEKQYKALSSLKRHKTYECGILPRYQCNYCGYRTKHNSSLRTHERLVHLKKSSFLPNFQVSLSIIFEIMLHAFI